MKPILAAAAISLVLLAGSLGLPTTPREPVLSRDAPLVTAPVVTDVTSSLSPVGAEEVLPALSVGVAAPTWNPSGAIHPGIQTYTAGAQCTANFVFYDASSIYIGQAAHCAATGAATDTNGCTAGTRPLGTSVDLGTSTPGTLVYSSWVAMQAANTPSSAPECMGNDFALVKVAAADAGNVNPAVPFFGGPVGVAPTAGLGFGESVYSFGNSGLRFGFEPVLSWKHGSVVFADAWSVDVYTATPGIPGDSGSGFLDAEGNAIGVLSTVAILPLPLSNQVSGLHAALGYAASHGGPSVTLATAPWVGGLA